MHDPLTQILRIPNIFVRKSSGSYRPSLITLWHRDPERRGDDDSCDWFGSSRPLSPAERAITDAVWDLETLLDNPPHYPSSREHVCFQELKNAVRKWRRRGWRIHPRWHVHHWWIQWNFLESFWRRWFERCDICHERFKGSSSVFGDWSGKRKWCEKCNCALLLPGPDPAEASSCGEPRFLEGL